MLVWGEIRSYDYSQSGYKINYRKLKYLLKALHTRLPVLVCKSGWIKYTFCVNLSSQHVICKYIIFFFLLHKHIGGRTQIKYEIISWCDDKKRSIRIALLSWIKEPFDSAQHLSSGVRFGRGCIMESIDMVNHGMMLFLNTFSLQQFVTQRFLELVTLYLIAVDG